MRDHKSKARYSALQHTLEDGGVDTTITWDRGEVQSLVRSTPFDVTLIEPRARSVNFGAMAH